MSENEQYRLHDKACRLVFNHIQQKLAEHDETISLDPSCVYIVWFSKTLQNWKALVTTTYPESMYYEVTYDGNRKRAYIDIYQRIQNVSVDDEPPVYDTMSLTQIIDESDARVIRRPMNERD